ncbi:MAG TPA: ATP-binding protein [Acetobacteraceae bacterium]|nr:ATP-binding protein [Acetobacteraceae bacterium]
MPESDGGFTLRVERSMAGLARLGGWLDGIAAALRLDTRSELALRLCVEEAASNVVMHGAPGDADAGFVELRVAPEPEALRVIVEDRCGAFDPLTVPEPDLPTRLEDARVGGLGIHLMRQYAKSIDYERRDGTNRLILSIPLTRALPLSREAGSSREADRQG